MWHCDVGEGAENHVIRRQGIKLVEKLFVGEKISQKAYNHSRREGSSEREGQNAE